MQPQEATQPARLSPRCRVWAPSPRLSSTEMPWPAPRSAPLSSPAPMEQRQAALPTRAAPAPEGQRRASRGGQADARVLRRRIPPRPRESARSPWHTQRSPPRRRVRPSCSLLEPTFASRATASAGTIPARRARCKYGENRSSAARPRPARSSARSHQEDRGQSERIATRGSTRDARRAGR